MLSRCGRWSGRNSGGGCFHCPRPPIWSCLGFSAFPACVGRPFRRIGPMTQLPPSKGFFEVQEADEALALQALGWILADEPRAERLLGTTGLTPERLRASLGQRTKLGAVLGFLTAHEPDLVACAAAPALQIGRTHV